MREVKNEVPDYKSRKRLPIGCGGNAEVLKEGRWVHFELDLGNARHRNAFLSGQVPDGVTVIEDK